MQSSASFDAILFDITGVDDMMQLICRLLAVESVLVQTVTQHYDSCVYVESE